MAPACRLRGSVGGGLRKRIMASSHSLSGTELSSGSCLDARHFTSSLYATWCLSSCYPGNWSSEGVSLSKSCAGPLRGTAWDSQQFLPPTQSPLIFTARYGDLSSWHWKRGLWAQCGAWTPAPRYIPPNFYPSHVGVGPAHSASLHLRPPTSLDGCGFFNSVVVRLPFNSISDGSE